VCGRAEPGRKGGPRLIEIQILNGVQSVLSSAWIEIRNNFYYWNFSRFEIEFELKFRGFLCIEFYFNILGRFRI
jgi:hypothetical protein